MGRLVRAAGPKRPTVALFDTRKPASKGGKVAAGAQQADDADQSGADGDEKGDGYLERVAKYVPAEIVAFFIFVNAILSDAVDKKLASLNMEPGKALTEALNSASLAGIEVVTVSWFVIVVSLLMIPIYLFNMRDPDDPEESLRLNIVIALLAFPFWAYAVDAVAFRQWHDGALASVLLATFSVISGAISPELVTKVKSSLKGG